MITKPTFVVDTRKAIKNLDRMASKAKESNVRFRPHFKTHQSIHAGAWFKQRGISQIAVSSVEMASFFAEAGWKDITVAFPANILEIDTINRLASTIELNLLVESMHTAEFLADNLANVAKIWMKVDVGSKRTGTKWSEFETHERLATRIRNAGKLKLQGLLAHAGHAYAAATKDEIIAVYEDTAARLQQLRSHLKSKGIAPLEISVGDTPTCTLVESLQGVDEIRPGNFIYFDLMQVELGVCTTDEIAVAVACPVVAVHQSRQEVVVHGGAVHLSKECTVREDGSNCYGLVCQRQQGDKWNSPIEGCLVVSISQEHGIIRGTQQFVKETEVGDVLMVLPVHSCLTANLMRSQTLFV